MNKKLRQYLKGKEECCKTVIDSIIKFTDKNKKAKNSAQFTIQNPDRKTVYKIRVDDCLIKSADTKKCDWIAASEAEKVFLIELKATNLHFTSIGDQFLGTIDKIGLNRQDCCCFLVYAKFNKRKNDLQPLIKKMRNKNIGFKYLSENEAKFDHSDFSKSKYHHKN